MRQAPSWNINSAVDWKQTYIWGTLIMIKWSFFFFRSLYQLMGSCSFEWDSVGQDWFTASTPNGVTECFPISPSYTIFFLLFFLLQHLRRFHLKWLAWQPNLRIQLCRPTAHLKFIPISFVPSVRVTLFLTSCFHLNLGLPVGRFPFIFMLRSLFGIHSLLKWNLSDF